MDVSASRYVRRQRPAPGDRRFRRRDVGASLPRAPTALTDDDPRGSGHTLCEEARGAEHVLTGLDADAGRASDTIGRAIGRSLREEMSPDEARSLSPGFVDLGDMLLNAGLPPLVWRYDATFVELTGKRHGPSSNGPRTTPRGSARRQRLATAARAHRAHTLARVVKSSRAGFIDQTVRAEHQCESASARLEARTSSTAGGQLAALAATTVEARLFDV